MSVYMWIKETAGIVGLILGIVIPVYALVLYFEAKSHVGTSPKQDMFICKVHGALPLDSTIDINVDGYEYQLESGEHTTGKVPYCSLCFEARIEEAKKHND